MRDTIITLKEATQTIMPGKWREVELALIALLARGHVLIEDVPGMGKTTLVRMLAKIFGLNHNRVQFTNDLLPADILGVSVFRPQTGDFQFRQGPLFAELVLADELNRAPPKTQSALLQAMEDRMVSIEGIDHPLPEVFTVMATQNPRGMVGTFPLPESQLDRFMMKFPMGTMPREAELFLLGGSSRREMVLEFKSLYTPAQLLKWQKETQRVLTSQALLDYVMRLLEESRKRSDVRGLSPRAGIDLVRAGRARAWLQGRGHVLPEDIQDIFPWVAGHRLVHQEAGCTQEQLLARGLLESIAVV
jgi:MoxR-like ATPase